MNKFLLKSALIIAVASTGNQVMAQDYIPFEMYGFMTKSDVSYDRPQAQQYVTSKMIYTVDSTSPYFLQKQTNIFPTKIEIDNQWVRVSSCYVRNNVMYAIRYDSSIGLNRISSYDEKGNETFVMDVPTTNGYITQAAYVEDEDMIYMVLSSPRSSNADLYKAPGENPADMTLVANITTNFMEKPFSFTYVHEKNCFYYVTNSAQLYGLSLTGEKDFFYAIHPDNASLPSDGSGNSGTHYTKDCSGLVWAAPYNMLIWVCPRGSQAGSALTYWYGLELIKGSETPVVHRLLNHVDSGLSNNYYNCIVTNGISMSDGLPPAPTYVSVYTVNSKPGYYDASWSAVKNDVNGQPIEGEVYYNVYIGDKQIAKVKQPVKGITVGLRFLLPHAYAENTFYIGVETVTEAGKSPMKVEGPFNSIWDPNDPGHWYNEETPNAVNEIHSSVGVNVSGNYVSISGLDGDTAEIISIDGKLITILTEDSIVELQSGMYIVKTIDKTSKILIK